MAVGDADTDRDRCDLAALSGETQG
jgi:hypothetical protein